MSACKDSSHTSYCPDCCPDAFMCTTCVWAPEERAERSDVVAFIEHPPGRIPEDARACVADLAKAIRSGAHVGWTRGRLNASKEHRNTQELRELLRCAQHHVPRGWPQASEWLDRALAVLGHEHAHSGSGDLYSEVHYAPTPIAEPTEHQIGTLERESTDATAVAMRLLNATPRSGLLAWAKDIESGGKKHLREWATHAAPFLTEERWATVRRARLSLDRTPSEIPEVVIAKNLALLAYRDEVIAGLNPEQRSTLINATDLAEAPGFEWMHETGIIDEHCEPTPFVNELVRRMMELGEDRVTPCQD